MKDRPAMSGEADANGGLTGGAKASSRAGFGAAAPTSK